MFPRLTLRRHLGGRHGIAPRAAAALDPFGVKFVSTPYRRSRHPPRPPALATQALERMRKFHGPILQVLGILRSRALLHVEL